MEKLLVAILLSSLLFFCFGCASYGKQLDQMLGLPPLNGKQPASTADDMPPPPPDNMPANSQQAGADAPPPPPN